ncbi:MAG: hypothetical protein ABIN97_07065 [Ginsengibacter sp.]
MKYFFILTLFLALGAGCKRKKIPETDLKLAEAMKGYLSKTLNPGTEITIKALSYHEQKNLQSYICDFQVNLHRGNWDTTGLMSAIIKSDFSKVDRIK